jgi:16S rRNA C967 or C1407 C5-methylase (RsmB/RsmF family)
MFHEISLSPGLSNSRTDSVEGFVDSFMVKGIYKKWKERFCCTFCEGITSTDQQSKILNEVIRQLRSCGLIVLATISDQGTTNQAVVNQLISSTNRHFAELNEENTIQGYLNDEVHLFDLPHLMKCIN